MHSAKTPFALAALFAAASFSCASDVAPPSGSPAATARPVAATEAAPAAPAASEPAPEAEAEVADGSVRFASLVPEGSFVWVEVESLDELIRMGDEILAVAAGDGDAMSFEDLLAFFPAEGLVENIDSTRPMGLAVGFVEGSTTPESTVVLPTLDRAAVIQSFRSLPEGPEVFGIDDYVVATTLPEYEPGLGSAALTEGLPEGQVVARFDVPAFVEATGEMVELALWQLKTEAGMPADAGGPATELEGEMRLAVIDAVTKAVNSAASLDLALSLEGDELDLSMALVVAEGSELDGLFPEGGADLRELASLIDEEDSLSMLMSLDAKTLESLLPLWSGALETAGIQEGNDEAAAALLRDSAAVWPLMGEGLAVAGGTEPGDLHLSYFFQPTDREAFVEGLTAVFGRLDEITPGLRIDGPMQLEGETLFHLAVEEAAEGVNLEELMRREEDLQRLFGTLQVPVRLAEKDGTTVMTIGGGEDLLERSLARIGTAPSSVPASLVEVLDRVDGSGPAFVAQFDLVALTRDLLTLVEGRADTDLEIEIPADADPLPVTYYGGVDGLEWQLGFRADFRRLGELMRHAR